MVRVEINEKTAYVQAENDSAFFEINGQLESQRLELYQANQWADQGCKEKRSICLKNQI